MYIKIIMKYHLIYAKMARIKNTEKDFPGGLVVNNLLCNARHAGLIPDGGTKIPHGATKSPYTSKKISIATKIN